MRMFRFLALLGLLAAQRALPDIITDVSVDGSVDGFGMLSVHCTFPSDCPPDGTVSSSPLSFNGANYSLGPFSASGGTVLEPTQGGGATLTEEAQQMTSANGFSLEMDQTDTFTPVYLYGYFATYNGNIYNNETLSFAVTTETLMDLTASREDDTNAPQDSLTLTLADSTGPPLFYAEDFLPVTTDLLVLSPGTYELTGSLNESPLLISVQGALSADSKVQATFSPIPEPQLGYLIPLLLFAAGGALARGRRRLPV